ncbi:hypothetical protein BDP67DRAFT_491272 [Colletotrichum lupini]|nr:hypothetical protein BDP67DRAFT_491272 [Colletotrichum lupini]
MVVSAAARRRVSFAPRTLVAQSVRKSQESRERERDRPELWKEVAVYAQGGETNATLDAAGDAVVRGCELAILVDNSNLPRPFEKQCKSVAGIYLLMGWYVFRIIPWLGLMNNVSRLPSPGGTCRLML